MTSPMPPEPRRGNAPATPNSPTRLALTSLLLSLAPLMAFGLIRLVAVGASSLPGGVVTVLSVIVYAGSFIGSLGAVVTGWLAMSRARQHPPQQAVQAAAVAGIVIGILGMVILVVGGVVIGLLLHACSTPANCG